MEKIAIVGAGLVGRAWACVFATHGFRVAVYDAKLGTAEAAYAHIADNLAEMARLGLVLDASAPLGHVQVAGNLEDALRDAVLVQESGPETIEAKRALFARMDAIAAPETILASSTSSIMASAFSEDLKGRARCLVGHPVNPPHLVPIVEIAPAPWTAPETVTRAKALYEVAGQTAITLRREKPGFILNRLQAVLLAEAFRLVGEGVASAEDVDKTVRDGLGLRWSFMGPFETIALNAPGGIPDYCSRYGKAFGDMVRSSEGTGDAFSEANIAAVMSEWSGARSEKQIEKLSDWRDRRLGALAVHKRAAEAKPEEPL